MTTIKHFLCNNYIVIVISVLTIIGFILRAYHLDWQCLMTDEKTTFSIVQSKNLIEIFWWSLGGDYNPPTYYLLAKTTSILIGNTTIFSIRLPSLILGTLAIPISYLLGKQFNSDLTGILVATVITISYPFIYYSQNARAYMLIFVVFMLYTYYFITIYRGNITNFNLYILGFLTALCLWSHFYSIVPLTVCTTILLLKYGINVWKVFLPKLILCLPFVLYLGVINNHYQVLPSLVHNAFWLSPIDITLMLPTELFGYLAYLIIPLILISVYINRENDTTLILFIVGLITAISCPITTLVISMSPRYCLLISPLFLLVGLSFISDYISKKTIDKQVVLIILFLYIIIIFNYGSLLSWYTFNTCNLF